VIELAQIVAAIGRFYVILIVVYILMTWLPMRGIVYDIHRVLATIVEPYLAIFRRFIPPLGMIDISPLIAVLVFNILLGFVVNALYRL